MNIISIKKVILSLLLVVFVSGLVPLAVPETVASAESVEACSQSFLGFPTWYRGLIADKDCNLKSPADVDGGIGNYIWHIVLNVIEIVMMLVVYLSVIFIIYGGILFITSAGSADGVKKGKASITNAVIGLVISIVAVAVVEFIFSRLKAGA